MKQRRSQRRRELRNLITLAAIFLLHAILLHGLAQLGLIEQLLTLGGLESLGLVLIAALFFALRLFVYFLLPGLALIAIARWIFASRKKSNRSATYSTERP